MIIYYKSYLIARNVKNITFVVCNIFFGGVSVDWHIVAGAALSFFIWGSTNKITTGFSKLAETNSLWRANINDFTYITLCQNHELVL